jgi:nucleoside-diphosphate-sugar epimerase
MKQSKNRKILVIGGAGYIGSVLVRRLLNDQYSVVVLDNLVYDNKASLIHLMSNSSFSFVRGDFCDNDTLDNAMANVSDVVLLAALVGDPLCKKYPDEAIRVNEEGSIDLINRLNRFDLDKFVFLSTCSNYGLRDTDIPVDEKAELNPKSLYAKTKVNVERHIIDNINRINYSSTILRSATAFGLSPRMRFDLTVSEFTRELTLGRELIVYDENTWRPYCHVNDISSAILKVLNAPEKKVSGNIFNVGSNSENYTKKNIVDIICSKLGECKVKYERGGRDPRNYRVNFDKIVEILDFQTKRTVDDSVIELIGEINAGRFIDIENNKSFYGNYFLNL